MKQASGSTLLTAGKKGGPGIRLLTFVLVLFASLSVSAALAQEARNDVRVDAPAGIPDTDTSNNAASDSDPITRSLTVRKVVMPAGDSGQFIMSANGTNGAAGGTGAQAVNLTVQAGQTVSFGEAANAGTSLANYSSNYRCASVDSAGAEIAELKTGATSSGDVVMPSANVVCTITNTRRSATLTLVKTWTNGKQNDQIALTVVRGATELDRLISTAAGGAAQTDTDTTPTTVYAGDSLTVAESFNQGAPANYTSAISCQGVNATNGSYTVDPADSAITCTATNERRSTLFSITKTWTNPRSGDSATIAPTTGLANNTAELVVAAATDASTAQVTVFAGEVATLPAETMTPAGALANYTTSVSCSGAGSTLTGTNGQAAGNTVAFSGSVSPTTPVSCTYRNERTPVQMTLRKQWTGADIGDAASITVTRNAGVIRTFTPAAGMTTELDVDFAFQVFSGDTLTLAETVSGNGTYDQQLLCSGAADSDPSDGLLVTPADTSIICTYTNTGAARVRVAKTTLGGVGTFTFAGDNGYAGDTITTTAAGATVNGTRDALAVNNTVTTITEDAPGAGWALTAINCAGLPAGGTFTPNLGSRSVELNAAATAPGANVTCTFTNSRLPTITVSKTSQGGVDAFTFTGNNGYDGDSITTVTAGTPVAAATQTLDAANAATFVAESAPPPGWALTGINCTGLPAGGTATYDLATRRVDLNAAATAPGAAVSCAFTNVRLPTITISKVSQGGVDTFGFTGSNGYDGDSIATVTAGTPVAAPTQTLDVAGNATFFTEASLPAGWSLTGIECTGIPTGSATYNTATRRVDLTAAATVAGAAIACTFTNSRLPTITVSKRTLGGAGSFGFSGSNGYDGDSITTVTAGTPVAAATQTLDVAGAITTITEAAPPAGWGLTGINCSGVPVGSATPNLATRSVQLNAAATAAGATISCEFVNAKRPTLQIVKVARDNAGGESFSFSGNNGFGSDSLVVTADGTSNGVVKVLSSGIDTTITEAASGFYLESIACRDQSGSIAVVPDLASRSVTVPGANLLPGAEVVCTFTNVSPRPSLSLEKSILNSGDATEVGDEINYRYVVSNDGNVPLTGVTLSDDKIPNAGDFSCDSAMPATIPVNGQVICTANYATTQADFDLGSVTNNARATDDAGVTDADNATETLIRTPRLTLVKSAAPATYDSLGDIINYTYLVTNSGNVTVSAPITITDDKIPSASIVCDAIADGELSPAAPGATPATAAESVTCRASYTIVQADLDNGSIVNTASAASDEGVVSNEDDATVTASQNAGISVVKTKQDNSFNAAGQPLDYAYVVTNTGNVTLTDVQLVDDKIATLNCTPALPATLAPGGLINCTAVYTTQQGDVNAGSVTNVATVTASPPTGPAVTDTDTQTVTAVQDASLALVKEIVAPIPTLFNVGEILHYRYTITNDGNVTLKQPFAVNDNLIDDVSCPATPAQLLPTQTIQCTASYTITADDVGNTGVVTNAASASGLDLNDGPVTSNNDTESFPIGATPILGITKVGAPGTYDAVNQTITYTYEVSNRGNVGIAGPIVVHDDKLGSIECLAAGNFLPAADPDASVQCTATHATTQADLNEGEIENEAFATGRAGGQTVTSNTVQEIVEADQNPQLAVVKSVPSLPFNDANGNGRPDAGETVTYTITVTNNGNVRLTILEVDDPAIGVANAGLTTVPIYSDNDNDPTTLDPGESGFVTRTYTLLQSDIDNGEKLNTATASATAPDGSYVEQDGSKDVDLPPSSALTLDKQGILVTSVVAPNGRVDVGDRIDYTFLVTNTGNVTLSDLVVNDPPLAPAVTVSCPATTLAPGASTTCTASRTLNQADLDAGQVVNTAQAAASLPDDDEVSSNPDSVTVTLPAAASIAVDKVAGAIVDGDGNGHDAGDTISYSFTVSNTGNTTLTNVRISDPKLGLSDVPVTPATLAPGATGAYGPQVYTLTQADIDAGTVNNTATAAGAPPTGADVTGADSTATPITRAPALTLVKAAVSPAAFDAAGDTIDYTYRVTNSGNTTLTAAVSVNDDKIASVNCPAMPGGGLQPGQFIECTGTYTVSQQDVDAGSVVNLARAQSGPTQSNQASETVDGNGQPAMTLIKTAAVGSSFDAAGDTIIYNYEVTNTGDLTLYGPITIADDKINGAAPQGTVSCPAIPSSGLAPDETLLCTGTYIVTQPDVNAGQVENVARASSSDPRDPSGDAVESNADNEIVTGERNPSLTVVKTQVGGPDPVTGLPATLEYEVVVDNTGNVDLTGVTPSDALTNGAGTALALTSGLTLISGDANNDSVLNVNETWTYAGTYVVTQADLNAGGNLTNVASVETDQTPAAVASDPVVTPVTPPASISITKVATLNGTGAVNDTISYAFTVTNTGNVPLTDVSVSDALPGIVVDGGPLALLDVGASDATTFTATYTIRQTDVTAGNVTNSATVTGTPPVGPDVTDASDDPANPANVDPNNDGNPDDPTVVALPQTPQIGVAKAASAPVLNADGTFDVIYTINVENTGNVELSDLQLQDDLTSPDQLGSSFVSVRAPPQVVLINVSGQAVEPTANPAYAGTAANPDLLAGTDGLLMPGDGYRVTFTVTINPYVAGAPAVFANIATASGATVGGMRVSDLSNNGSDPGNQPGGPGSPTIVVPPAAPAADVTLTKTASVRLAKRGDVIAYTITVQNNRPAPTGEISVIDNLPAGFIYVEGSAELDGVAVTPVVSGNRVQVDGVSIPGNGKAVITIRVKISTSVEPGDHTNVADAIDPATGNAVAVRAKATVRISIEHVFDCGEIIGKVFDDANRNGYQDDGERGMPGVRLATVRGVLITTDRHGRFSVPCADIPDARIGSNFLLKLDTRTLPTGYRLTTENPRDVRLTAGKVTKLNFGVAIDRVVRIDLNNAAFAAGSVEPSRKLRDGIAKLIKTLDREHSVVRLTYYATAADEKLAQKRLKTVSDLLTRAWREARGSYELGIETKVIRK